MPKQTLLLLKHYNLCKHCLKRHITTTSSSSTTTAGKPSGDLLPHPCYICRGLMDNLDALAKNILASVKGFEFDTFLIGATLSTQLHEREDIMRARLKIRGRESIKHYMTRELGIRLSRLTGKQVKYGKPDITVTLTVDKENNVNVEVISRPLALAGVYIKKSRGVPQKQDRCASCGGKGCNSCNYSGISGYDSVEGIIANELIQITGGQTPKFTWMGSEDQNSLVLGSGRPFYVRVFNPKKRKLRRKNNNNNNKKTTIKANGIKAILSVINDIPVIPPPRFIVKTKIHIRSENPLINNKILKKKLNSLSGSQVSFENKSKKIAVKSIHSVHVRQLDSNQFTLTVVADGGLMIKQLVGGEEYMEPNISEVLGTKCECTLFDILDVQLQ